MLARPRGAINIVLYYRIQFRNLQEKALRDYAERLTSPSVGENVLTTFLQARNIRDVCQTFNILEQSWWLKLLILSYMLVTLLYSIASLALV
jgi:hypothetical protein